MIRKITVKRFKQFDEAPPFELAGHMVLAGQNNSGKTTMLQALSAWMLAYEQWRTLNDFVKHGGAYSKKPITRQAFNAVPLRSFSLLWHDLNGDRNIEIGIESDNGLRLTMEFIADSTEQMYVRPVAHTSREMFDREYPTMVYVSSVDGLEIEEPAHNPEWIKTLLGRQRPGSILRNLLLEVSRSETQWTNLCSSVKRLFGLELLVPDTPGGQIICEYHRTGSEYRLDIMNAGSGLHQVLLLLACLHTRAGSVLLIDEPDAHLHVFLQDTIFAEIRQVAARNGSQVILATHSEVIFRSVPPENLTVMMGTPRRLSSVAERDQLAAAMGVLEQVDVINALTAPGVLYVEGYTDLNLLRKWAERLDHPALRFFEREPFWKPQVWEARTEGAGIKAAEHYRALQLVRGDLTGVWLVDSDGKGGRAVQQSEAVASGALNRIKWARYESESYLIHPAALARFIGSVTGNPADDVVRGFFARVFGSEQVAEVFIVAPFAPPPLVENYLKTTKARTEVVGALLEEAGIHGFDYTRFDEIAAVMLPEEIHPEVREKLDFIQRAFGL